MRRLLFILLVITSILALAGFYLGHRLLQGSAILASHPKVVWVGVVTFLVFVLIGPMLSRILPSSLGGRFYALRWLINMTMAIFFSVLFYTIATDLFLYLLRFVASSELSLFAQEFSLPLIALFVACTLVVGAVQALTPKICQVSVPIKGLPLEFDGFKIAQISDLHIGEMIGHSYVRAVVEMTNALGADIIALTGDIIDGAPALVAPVAADLSGLKASAGTFYVTGNHEYYWGVEHALAAIRKTGARVLMNENIRIRRGANEIAIAGVTDISAGKGVPGHSSDPEQSVQGLPADMIKILLAHQPVSFRGALKARVHLQLSGHTHGGQFFPWSLVVRFFQRYNKGLIRHDDLWIYVNRGTATWGPRLRFGIPPEITLLTLRRQV